MAGQIKGITIVFNGETTKLDKALNDINKKTRDLDKELKQVDKALKFNPTNVELWRQKQQLLTEKVKETKDKLDLLKQAQAKMDASGVDKNSQEYRNLQREIIETTSKCKTFETQLKEIGNVKLKAAQEQLKQIGTELTNAGQALAPVSKAAAAVTGGLIATAVSTGKAADDLNTLSKVTGIGVEQLQKYAAAADFVDVSVETIAKSQQKLKKQMASAQGGTKAAAENFKKLGVNFADASGNLRDSDEVFQEVIAALGQMENETERDALAMEIFGKSAGELNPLIEDCGETYQKVSDIFEQHGIQPINQEQIDKAQQFQDKLDELKLLGSTALQELGAKAAEALLPALEKIVEWGGKIVKWISDLSPEVVQVVAIIGALLAVLSPLLIMLGALATAAGALNIAMLPLIGIILAIIAAIGALVYAGVYLANHWEEIKEKAKAAWDAIKNAIIAVKDGIVKAWENLKQKTAAAWDAIKNKAENVKTAIAAKWDSLKQKTADVWGSIRDKMTNAIEGARSKISGIIDRIRNFFPINIGNIFGHISLPHFSLSGKLSLNPPSVPHLSVDWYDKGGIFSSPTVIGVGEKRPEFVGALDDLREIVREEAGGGGVTINVYASPGMDEDALARKVEQKLVQLQKRRNAAYGTI